jgi:p-cumate 2,3-dioxygenase beta subunit
MESPSDARVMLSDQSSTIPSAASPRAEYEDFLFHEAALLDEWRLADWLELFLDCATYEVPSAGSRDDADASQSLFYIADDYPRLCQRVQRLSKRQAHSEYPRPGTLRVISNVRVLDTSPSGVVVACAFITYRAANDVTDCYFGHHRYLFRQVEGRLRIAAKRSQLGMSSLRPQGRIGIIL